MDSQQETLTQKRKDYKMIVTSKEYFMETKLVEKLDLMVKRMNGADDNLVIIDGDEGQGKTNLAMGICHYVSEKTGRNYTTKNIFFDLDKLMKFASETKEQIIHWDEGALGGLSMQWWKKNQQKFLQLLMVARKKKHFWVIAIPKFNKLNEYIVVDRSIALIHVYSRGNIQKGRLMYYTKQKKELLFDEWKRARRKSYNKYKSFGGSFLEYDKKVFSAEELAQYDKMKDEAILSIVKDEDEPKRLTMTEMAPLKRELFYKTWKGLDGITQEKLAEAWGVSKRTGEKWIYEYKKQIQEGVIPYTE
jgi:archaellum biogenesis ATPase FlaH